MKTRQLLATATILSSIMVATPVYANASASAPNFVKKASVSSMFEIQSSELALQRSDNPQVREFASQMVTDHNAASERLEDVLDDADSQIEPAEQLDPKHAKLLSELESVSDNRFDARYLAIQTQAHREAVDLFSTYAKNGKDQPLKQFARETLPTLKNHLAHVRKLH